MQKDGKASEASAKKETISSCALWLSDLQRTSALSDVETPGGVWEFLFMSWFREQGPSQFDGSHDKRHQ